MVTYINQPFGAGDIIFTMTLAEHWREHSDRIVWPVLPHFVEGLQRAYPSIEFIPLSDAPYLPDQTYSDTLTRRILPFRFGVEIMQVPYERCMEAKYTMYGLDYRTWKEKAMWQRDQKKEQALFDLVTNGQPYTFINENYTSNLGQQVSIPVDGIRMQAIDGYSLFDWCLVLERADAIHTVSTSLLYILELLPLTRPIHLYPRPTDPAFKQVDCLFTKPYILHA